MPLDQLGNFMEYALGAQFQKKSIIIMVYVFCFLDDDFADFSKFGDDSSSQQ